MSSIVDGKVLDWHWKKRETDTLFYVGDIFIGQLFNGERSGWSAVYRNPTGLGCVDGFKTRYTASNFMLKFAKNEGLI